MANKLVVWLIFSMVVRGMAESSASPRLSSITLHPTTISAANLIPKRIYEVQKSDSVGAINWQSAGFLWDTGQGGEWSDTEASDKAFYRLKQTSRQLFESRVRIENYLVYYGFWDETLTAKLRQYDLVVLNPNNGPSDLTRQKAVVQGIRAGADGVVGTKDDVLVFGYVSMGEDQRTFNHAAADRGDGTGPCYFDRQTGAVVYENNGYASYYLDEWDAGGPPAGNPIEHDGLPDRNGDWGACYVNAGDPKWQAMVIGVGRADRPIGFDAIANLIAFDGFFLDTPEVASPWERFGWTAKGIHDLIVSTRQLYPDKIFLLNRGLFFFVPHYPAQYRWSPRQYIDLLLYESYYLDSAYPSGSDYHLNGFFNLNRNFVSPKVNAELGRPDSFMPVLSIDYSRDPANFPSAHPDIYADCVREAVKTQGRLELITDRDVLNLDNPLLDHPAPPDTSAPVWDNTTTGFLKDRFNLQAWDFEARGDEASDPAPPRTGIQKAIPTANGVTVQWDAALDQTRRVKYNVYYSEKPFSDFDQARCLKDVAMVVTDDYSNRSFIGYDDACPYAFHVTGLSNDITYYFAVRAEDSTQGAASPSGGRIGPNGGIEETNQLLLAASLRRGVIPIIIDAKFDDWAGVPVFSDPIGDAQGGGVDWVQCKITDDVNNVCLYVQCASAILLSDRYVVYFNTDQKSHTGYVTQKGADYMLMGSGLYRYAGAGEDWNWTFLTKVDAAIDRDQMEMRIAKTSIQATTIGGGLSFFLYADNPAGAIDRMPDGGCAGYSYSFIVSPPDASAPEFDVHSVAAVDAGVDGVVVLTWAPASDPNGPVQYEVFRNAMPVASTSQTRIRLTGLSNGIPNSFYITASDKLGNKTTSPAIMATATKDAMPPVWAKAAGVQKVVAQDGMAKLYWNKANDERHPPARFNIYYAANDIVDYASAMKIEQAPLTVSDDSNFAWMCLVTGLTNNQLYTFSVRCEDRLGNEDSNTNRIAVAVQAALRLGTYSMDGSFGDWANDPTVVSCGLDTLGDGAAGDVRADIAQCWLGNNATHLFVRWGMGGAAAPSAFEYIVFIDTDRNPATGYLTDWQAIGADFMAINGSLYKYSGTGGDWAWTLMPDNILFSPGAVEKSSMELALARSSIGAEGAGRSIAVWFYVSDKSNATVDDVFPNYGAGGVSYIFK